jgi:hypothetical protein
VILKIADGGQGKRCVVVSSVKVIVEKKRATERRDDETRKEEKTKDGTGRPPKNKVPSDHRHNNSISPIRMELSLLNPNLTDLV